MQSQIRSTYHRAIELSLADSLRLQHGHSILSQDFTEAGNSQAR